MRDNPFADLIPKKQEDENDNSFERYAGIGARGLVKGIGAVPDLLALPSNIALGLSGKEPLPSVSENLGKGFDYLTNNKYTPESLGEKSLGTAAEFVSGGGGFAKTAQKTGSKFAQKFLAPKAASEYTALAGAGVGTELGKEYDPESAYTPIIGGLFGAVAPSAAKGAFKAATNPMQPIASSLGVNPQKYTAFKEAGLTPTLGDITDSRFIQGTQNIVKEVPFGSKSLSKTINDTRENIYKFGEGQNSQNAGELVRKSLKNWQKRGQRVTGKLKENFQQYVAPNENIPINNTLKVINEGSNLITPEAKAQFAKSPIGKEYAKLQEIAARNQGAIPYEDLNFFRGEIDDAITTFGKIGNKSQGALKNLRANIQKDIKELFNQKSPEAQKALDKYNKFYSNFADKNEQVIGKLLNNKTAVETYNNIANNLKVDGNRAKEVLRTMKPEEKKIFTNSLIRELGMNPQNEFTPAYLATNFKKLEPTAQEVVLSSLDTTGKKQFRSIIESIDYVKDALKVSNPSGTFNQYLKFGTLAGAVAQPEKVIPALLGANITGRLMANQKFINWIGNASKIKSEQQLVKSISKLRTIAKTTPELATDIQKYLKTLNEKMDTPFENYFDDTIEADQQMQENPFIDLIPAK